MPVTKRTSDLGTKGVRNIADDAVLPTTIAVTSLTGTANQITVSSSTGNVTLSTPQNISTTASPTFAGMTLTAATPSLQLRETTTTSNVDVFLGQSGTENEGLLVRYESGTGHSKITNVFNANLYLGTNNTSQLTLSSSSLTSSVNMYYSSFIWMGGGVWDEDAGWSGVGSSNGNRLLMRHGSSNNFYIINRSGAGVIIRSGSGGTDYTFTNTSFDTGARQITCGVLYATNNVTFGGTGTDTLTIPYCAMKINRLWDGYPGIEIYNDTTWGPKDEFRIHGYGGPSGGDFSINLRIDGGTYYTSDARVKTNISNVDKALDTVTKLQGIRYQRMNRSLEPETHGNVNNGVKFGFLAQDCMDIIPEAVTKTENATVLENGWCDEYAVDYAQLTPLLVEAIKELNDKVTLLEGAL